jgi:hypothetical protein
MPVEFPRARLPSNGKVDFAAKDLLEQRLSSKKVHGMAGAATRTSQVLVQLTVLVSRNQHWVVSRAAAGMWNQPSRNPWHSEKDTMDYLTSESGFGQMRRLVFHSQHHNVLFLPALHQSRTLFTYHGHSPLPFVSQHTLSLTNHNLFPIWA